VYLKTPPNWDFLPKIFVNPPEGAKKGKKSPFFAPSKYLDLSEPPKRKNLKKPRLEQMRGGVYDGANLSRRSLNRVLLGPVRGLPGGHFYGEGLDLFLGPVAWLDLVLILGGVVESPTALFSAYKIAMQFLYFGGSASCLIRPPLEAFFVWVMLPLRKAFVAFVL